MKNYLLLFTGLLFSCIVNAQFVTGQKLIGGQLSFHLSNSDLSSTSGNAQRTTSVGLSPSFSRFVSPNVFNTIGFSYLYQHTRYNINSANEQNSNAHVFGIFVQRTKLESLAKKFYFTYAGTAGVNYQLIKTRYVIPGSNTDQNAYLGYVSGGIGLLYQVNKRFLLSCDLNNLFSVSFQHSDQKTFQGTSVYKSNGNNFGLTTGLSNMSLSSLSIGIKYMLKK